MVPRGHANAELSNLSPDLRARVSSLHCFEKSSALRRSFLSFPASDSSLPCSFLPSVSSFLPPRAFGPRDQPNFLISSTQVRLLDSASKISVFFFPLPTPCFQSAVCEIMEKLDTPAGKKNRSSRKIDSQLMVSRTCSEFSKNCGILGAGEGNFFFGSHGIPDRSSIKH